MECKAVIFDLFETLITEWGHKKYTKKEMCADLGIDRSHFDFFWEEKEQERYLGTINFENSIIYACEKCGVSVDPITLSDITDKRIKTKSACFNHIHPDVFQLLKTIRASGKKTAVVSNCSAEEVNGIENAEISQYIDEMVLSYKVQMKKPDSCIYREAAKRLCVDPEECIFVGDGGSNELTGAREAGMKAIQAKWYTNQFPRKRDSIDGFAVAEEPLDVMKYI